MLFLFKGITNLTDGFENGKDNKGNDSSNEIRVPSGLELKCQRRRSRIPDRDQWSGPLDFIMSMIAYAVGLGTFK